MHVLKNAKKRKQHNKGINKICVLKKLQSCLVASHVGQHHSVLDAASATTTMLVKNRLHSCYNLWHQFSAQQL
jgi:hypothetical protein